jgi:hypothetical protein
MRALLFALLLSLATEVSAQSSQPSAQEKYEEAKTFYNIGEYEKALAGFKEAYLLSKEPELLLNIAQCHRFLQKNQEAIRALQSFLQEAPNSPYAPEAQKLIEELSGPTSQPATSTSAPTSSAAPPKETPPTSDERRAAKVEAVLSFGGLGVFTGATGGAFLVRTGDINPTALYAVSSSIGAAGGLGLGLLYSNLLHPDGQRPKEVHPLPVGMLLGVGQGLTGSRLLNINKISPQATLSATYFSTALGLGGGVIASNLYDPSPGDSLLLLSGGAFGALFGASLVGAAQLDIELLNDFTVSALYNAGILGAGVWTWFVDVKRERVLLVDSLGIAGAASGALVGGLLQNATSDVEELPIQGGSIGAFVGGVAGLTAGFLVSKKWVAKRPKLQLATRPSMPVVLPVKQNDTTMIQITWSLSPQSAK